MKKLLNLILCFNLMIGMSFYSMGGYSSGVGASGTGGYCDEFTQGPYEKDGQYCFKKNCTGEERCIPKATAKEVAQRIQNNNVKFEDHRQVQYKTDQYNTTNIIGGGGEEPSRIVLSKCHKSCFNRSGRWRGSSRCQKCIDSISSVVGVEKGKDGKDGKETVTEAEIAIQVEKICEHSDKECNKRVRDEIIGEQTSSGTCVACEVEKTRADRDVALAGNKSAIEIAKIKAKAEKDVADANAEAAIKVARANNRGKSGFWPALASIGTAVFGYLGNREQTRQIKSCHNSYTLSSIAGVGIAAQNRSGQLQTMDKESANSLPLSKYRLTEPPTNYSFLCNGIPGASYAGGHGGYQGYGMGGYDPYGQGSGQYGVHGQGQFGFNLNIPGISAGVGNTPWSQGYNQGGYYSGNNTFNMNNGYQHNPGYNNPGYNPGYNNPGYNPGGGYQGFSF